MSDLVKVVYIGDKKIKKDNVLDTRRQWAGKGAEVMVPRAESEIYFSYPDIWANEEGAKAILRQKLNDSESAKPSPVEDTKQRLEPEAGGDDDRGSLIQGAILQLDPDNEAHFNKVGKYAGKPKLKALVDIIGFSVEAAEVDRALTDLRAAGKLQ